MLFHLSHIFAIHCRRPNTRPSFPVPFPNESYLLCKCTSTSHQFPLMLRAFHRSYLGFFSFINTLVSPTQRYTQKQLNISIHSPFLYFSLMGSTYTAVQATKTFSRSGSSKNSFTWKTVTKEFQSSIAVFDVILNFGFHTQDDSIDCNPEYSSVEEAERSTTVCLSPLLPHSSHALTQ
jgi:hypothetical protein